MHDRHHGSTASSRLHARDAAAYSREFGGHASRLPEPARDRRDRAARRALRHRLTAWWRAWRARRAAM